MNNLKPLVNIWSSYILYISGIARHSDVGTTNSELVSMTNRNRCLSVPALKSLSCTQYYDERVSRKVPCKPVRNVVWRNTVAVARRKTRRKVTNFLNNNCRNFLEFRISQLNKKLVTNYRTICIYGEITKKKYF